MEKLPLVNLQTAEELGLLAEEYNEIIAVLGRQPNFTELAAFSAMWSEHCSYKNSIFWLKKLPKEGPQILVKAGEENAGLVDIGGGLACAFKIESHNHPSAVAPFEGAATGVGGVNRDIFTMGARPIAQLNSLHMGDLSDEYTRNTLKGVVAGISSYGKGISSETVAGELHFNECYQRNPLVNAMSVGIMEKEDAVFSAARGVGNLIYIVGASTGLDGVHGAASASKELSEKSVSDFAAVPKGNPGLQLAVMEASLEAAKLGLIEGMQDMGAAGIICSTSEMAAKGEVGMRIDLDKVPLRSAGMKPFEILLSESQERMLVVVKKEFQEEFEAVFERWDVNCDRIGEVIEGSHLNFYQQGSLVASLPAYPLVLGGGAPVYHREYAAPPGFDPEEKFEIHQVPLPNHLGEVGQFLIGHVNLASRSWVTKQFSSPYFKEEDGGDAAAVPLPGSEKALALTVDSVARYTKANPRVGAAIAVAEAARNIVAIGGKPLAITNCLNFGDPYDPEVYWQFVEVILGMKEACEKLGTPVTGGNVSFYNQSAEGKAIYPTPVIGMLGVIDQYKKRMTLEFKTKGDFIYLLGEVVEDIASSEYLYSYHKIKESPAPYFNMEKELLLQRSVAKLIQGDYLASAHDVSQGGLYLSLLECAIPRNVGFAVSTDPTIRKDAFLFGESQSRMVVSVSKGKRKEFEAFVSELGVEWRYLGVVANSGNVVDDEMFDTTAHAKTVYNPALDFLLEQE